MTVLAARPASLQACRALVVDAKEHKPLSVYPPSVWPWQTTVRAVLLDQVTPISWYDREIRSPSFSMKLPAVVALNKDIGEIPKSEYPAFTRFNLFLRDEFCCQYCTKQLGSKQLTFDHVVPQSIGGPTNWENIVAACHPCNQKKADTLLENCGLRPVNPYIPSHEELQVKAIAHARRIRHMHQDWHDMLYWDQELGDNLGTLPWPTEDMATKMGLNPLAQPDRPFRTGANDLTQQLIIGS